MADTVTRMAPGELGPGDVEIHQGWSLRAHPPAPDAAPRAADVLFLHGMGAGGWFWREDWRGSFARAGFRGWTITLPRTAAESRRGPDLDRLNRAALTGRAEDLLEVLTAHLPVASARSDPTLEDLTDALEGALASIGRPVAVVAHSLGAAVAQNLLRRGGRPAATVLLCPVPPYGLWRASLALAATDPRLWRALAALSVLGVAHADLALLRQRLFPSGVAEAEFAELIGHLGDESLAVTLRARGVPPFAPLPGPRRDVLVIGGGRDALIPVADVWATAAWYGGLPHILPGAGHLPTFEPGAPALAAGIARWIARRTA